MQQYVLVNFGGPRSVEEILPFLEELLCDRDVIRTRLPTFMHNFLFRKVAKKRALSLREDYELIGGKSPIYFDTENLAIALSKILNAPVLTFHRYLPATHAESIEKIKQAKEVTVLPLFPQYCKATTGSIIRFFKKHHLEHAKWIFSYAKHPLFITSFQRRIKDYLTQMKLREAETFFLFSAHGIPTLFVKEGDPYQDEVESSHDEIMKGFPQARSLLRYISLHVPYYITLSQLSLNYLYIFQSIYFFLNKISV